MRSLAAALLMLSFTVQGLGAQTATTNPIGTGCPGTNGTPDLAVDQPPFLGETITFSLTNLPNVPGFAFFVLGSNDITWNGMPLPTDLGFTGMPGCNIYVSPEVGVYLAHSVPAVTFPFFVPDWNALLGCRLLGQALVCDTGIGNALGATTTNAVELVLGRR